LAPEIENYMMKLAGRPMAKTMARMIAEPTRIEAMIL
jgi:hypothetical protein